MVSPATKTITKHFMVILGSITIGYLLFVYLHYSQLRLIPASLNRLQNTYIIAFSVLMAYAIYFFTLLLNKYWAWRKLPAIKFLFHISALAILGVFTMNSVASHFIFNNTALINQPLAEADKTEILIRFAILMVNAVFLYTLVDYFIYSYKAFVYNKIKLIEKEKEKSILQLDLLQKQLSPHYLFNSLNTISSLLDQGAELTEKFIRKIVFTYSYVLSSCKNELVTLQEEMKLVRAYEFQLSTRFNHRVIISYHILDESLKKQLPPMAVQTLIENAIKHNTATTQNPLKIEIVSKAGFLVVKNNRSQAPELIKSGGVGLNNLKKRYELLNRSIKISVTDNFVVQIPLM